MNGMRYCAGLMALAVFSWPGVLPGRVSTVPATQVVLLGTGTPLPDPERAGPSTAIVANGTPYIVDAGTGLVRRAAAAREKGVLALRPVNLRIAFLTHLHSDHTLGVPDLMITPWVMGRKEPLELYGPSGTREPALLILTHRGNAGCDQAGTEECREAGSERQLLKEVTGTYSGKVTAGHDLEVY